MIRRLVTSMVCGTALLGLAACGQATRGADDGPTVSVARESASTGTRSDATPTPAGGCDPVATSSVDYGRAPQGYPTPEEAATAWNGVPDGTVVMAPSDGRGTSVWVVDPKTDAVKVAVSVIRGATGWYVDGVTTCA